MIRSMIVALSTIVLLGGCTGGTLSTDLSGLRGGLFGASGSEDDIVTLPQAVTDLDRSNRIHAAVWDAIDLSKQNRFAEARYILSQLRASQRPRSDGYRALTASMAVLALREGDMAAFRQHAGALDRSLDNKVRVDDAWVEIVAVHRFLVGGNLPVNTSTKLRDWLQNARAGIQYTSAHLQQADGG